MASVWQSRLGDEQDKEQGKRHVRHDHNVESSSGSLAPHIWGWRKTSFGSDERTEQEFWQGDKNKVTERGSQEEREFAEKKVEKSK